jgi:tetratricopeptide (TPR) repeat protein
MVAFLGVHLWRGRQSFRRLGPKRVAVSPRLSSNALALNIGALAAVASYLVHSVFDFNLHIPANVLLLAFVFGVLANDGVARENAAAEIKPRALFWWRLALPALGVLLLVQSARLLPGEYFAERSRAALRDERPIVSTAYALEGLKWDPMNPDLHFYLGLARLLSSERMGDNRASASFLSHAIAAFEKARALAPQDRVYALELATALDSAQRFEEAEQVYQDALRLDPKSTSVRQYYEGHVRLWRGSPATAQPPDEGES